MKPPRSSLLPGMLLMLCCGSLLAQTQVDPSRAADAANQAGIGSSSLLNERTVEGLQEENTFAPASPGDSDLGRQILLKRNDKARPFSAWVDSSFFWTDNAGNVDANKSQDIFYAGGINLSWQQHLKKRYYGDAYLGQHWYRFDSSRQLDYENGEVRLGILAVLPELKNAIFSAHFGYQRFTQNIADEALYEAYQLRLGLQKTFLIDRINSVNVGLLTNFAVGTSPDLLQRHEYALQLGYNIKLSSKWLVNTSYRLSYFDYFNFQGRQDWFQNMGAALSYRPTQNFDMSAGYYFAVNSSNARNFDYQSQLGGLSLAAKIRF